MKKLLLVSLLAGVSWSALALGDDQVIFERNIEAFSGIVIVDGKGELSFRDETLLRPARFKVLSNSSSGTEMVVIDTHEKTNNLVPVDINYLVDDYIELDHGNVANLEVGLHTLHAVAKAHKSEVERGMARVTTTIRLAAPKYLVKEAI